MSDIFAFAVFKTLPRSGKIAWNLRSRPCLAEPPAESPSTRYSSFFLGFLDCAGVNLPERSPLSFLFFLPLRDSSRALRAASLASRALIALRTRLKAHAKIDVICYYDDYDNAAWDQDDETYIYVETKAFEEIHSVNFPVQIILSNQGEIEDLDYYLLLGGDSRLTCDEIELEEIQPQKVDYEHICARP